MNIMKIRTLTYYDVLFKKKKYYDVLISIRID